MRYLKFELLALMTVGAFVCSPRRPIGAQSEQFWDDLPVSTGETSGPLTLTVKHKLTWRRGENKLAWEKLEMDFTGRATLRIEPGELDLAEGAEQKVAMRLDLNDGVIRLEPSVAGDGNRTIGVSAELAPRDIDWKDPPIQVSGVSLKGSFRTDDRLEDGPLPTLERFDLESLKANGVRTGPYAINNIEARASWDRPAWRVETMRAETFGGRIEITGHGDWGTSGDPSVSVKVKVAGLRLHDLLKAFEIPQADRLRARITGEAAIEAVGREWKTMSFDFQGEKGSVYLDRQLLYDILAPSFTEVLTQEQIELVLNGAFGRATMIPFEMGISGGLRDDRLRLSVPMENDAINLLIEPLIDRPLLWEIWDRLVETGLENVGATGLDIESGSGEDPEEN